MEAGSGQKESLEAQTEERIQVRQVTNYQWAWTEAERGAPGAFTLQLILDEGVEEYVVQPTADDADVLFEMLRRGGSVYFDLARKVLMFGNESTGPES